MTEEDSEQAFPYPVGFAATLRIAFDHFRNRFSTLAALFCGVHLFLTLLPFVFFFDIPDSTQLSLFLFLQILLPVSFGSVAVAIGTAIVANDVVGRDDVGPGVVWRSFGVLRRETFMAALVAAIVALLAALLLGFYGLFLLPLFYGPPLVAQALAVERVPLRAALRKARLLAAGNMLRVFVYLLNVSLGIGVVAFMVVGTLIELTRQAPEAATSIVLAVVQGIVLGLLIAYLACVQTVMYLSLRAGKEGYDAAALEAELDEGGANGPALGEPSPG